MTECNQIIAWIPVIGTLSGAILGLLASFLIAFFNRKTENLKEKAERDRKRLERAYELLLLIRKDKTKYITHLIILVISGDPIPTFKRSEAQMVPLVELEMIMKLYFPKLMPNYEAFLKVVQEIGSYALHVQRASYESKEPDYEQEEKLISFRQQIYEEVKTFQTQISHTIKA